MSLTRRLILQKARHHPTTKSRALTDCRRTVSGTLSLPSRGTFHHSLTVLIRYRSLGSIQAYRVVPADSQQIPRARCYSGTLPQQSHVFVYGALTLYGRPSQTTSTNTPLSLLLPSADGRRQAPQHRTHNPRRVSHAHGLAILRFRSPLLTESQLFSLPTGTEMFHFPAFPPTPMYSAPVTRHHSRRVSPFGHPRIHARLTAPRGISQPPTSFIGSQCQGIHHAPLNTYNTKNQKMSLKNSNIRNCTSTHKHNSHACLDARNHYPQIKHHTPPPKTGRQQIPIPGNTSQGQTVTCPNEKRRGLVVSKPNSVSDDFRSRCPTTRNPYGRHVCCCTRPTPTTGAAHLTIRPSHRTPTRCGRAQVSWCSLERR